MFEAHSVPLKIKASYNVSSNADGALVFGLQPNLSSAFAVSGATTTGNLTGLTPAQHPDYTSLSTQFSQWRPVSIGVKVYYLATESTSAGMISVGHNDNMQVATGNIGTHFPTTVADWSDLPNSSSVAVASMTEPICAASRAFDRASFFALTTSFFSQFPTCWVTATGVPGNTSVLRIETSFNLECIPLYGNNLTAHLQSVAYPNEGQIMDTHRRLGVVRTGSLSKIMAQVKPTRKAGMKRKRKYKSRPRRKYKRTSQTVIQAPRGARVARKRTYSSMTAHREGVRRLRY